MLSQRLIARAARNTAQRAALVADALGIIIGVASVIIMVTLGNGATAQVTRRHCQAWAATC